MATTQLRSTPFVGVQKFSLPIIKRDSRLAGRDHQQCVLASAGDTNNNLGVLQTLVDRDSVNIDFDPSFQLPPDALNHDVYVNWPAITGSSVLLILLLGISMERILGLDKIINKWVADWKEQREYQKREETIAARAKLTRLLSKDDEEENEGGIDSTDTSY